MVGAMLCVCGGMAKSQTLHTLREIVPNVELKSILPSTGFEFRLPEESRPTDVTNSMKIVEQRDLVRWGALPEKADKQAVWCVDGSWLCGEAEFVPTGVNVKSALIDSIALPWDRIRGVRNLPMTTTARWRELRRLMKGLDGEEDALWLKSGQKIAGLISIDTELSPRVRFNVRTARKESQIDASDVAAIVFSPVLSGPVTKLGNALEIGLDDGSLLRVSSMSLTQRQLVMKLQGGLEVRTLDPLDYFVPTVTYLRSTPAFAIMLGDTDPASYRQLDSSGLRWELGRNQSEAGMPLVVDDGPIQTGIAMHSHTQVAYRLSGEEERFVAELCMAQPRHGSNERLGSVRCKVLLAKDQHITEVAQYDLRRSGLNRVPVQVELNGARLLALVVEPLDFSTYGDEVVWGNARVISSRP